MSTSPDDVPDGFEETMRENNWSEEERRAWRDFHAAIEGDEVLFADRSIAMEVVETGSNDDGQHYVEVAQPRADGTYRVTEKYENGNLRLTTPVGRGNDFEIVNESKRPRRLSEDEVENLVARLSENAVDAFMRQDYSGWSDSVDDVVTEWAEMVSLRNWRSYKHHPDWEDGDAEAIFRSVEDHLEEHVTPTAENVPDTPKERAKVALYDAVYRYGRDTAEASIIQNRADYDETVSDLAHHTVDRYGEKNYADARRATRDTISDWVDDRESPAIQSVLEHGDNRFEDTDYADGMSEEKLAREKAFDILDHEVWEQVQRLQREKGEHDPTLRGLTFTNYKDLIDLLIRETVRRYDGNDRFLRTTAKAVVKDWATAVENREWEGHRHRVYAEGDVEDIFASAAIHADADPFVWNPFSRHRDRKMAVRAMLPEVHEGAERTLDERDDEQAVVPANEYLQENLGLDDVTYNDLRETDADKLNQMAERAVEAADEDIVGWTFVDEILAAGGRVPESTNDWVLIDYGVIRRGERLRKLAWMDRETGDVVVMSGMATFQPGEFLSLAQDSGNDSNEGEVPTPGGWTDSDEMYDGMHVTYHDFDNREPEFLLRDESLEEALRFIHDYIEVNRADLQVIETDDGAFVLDDIEDDDINTGGVMDALVPNSPISLGDLSTLADDTVRREVQHIGHWSREITGLAAFVGMAAAPKILADRLEGIRIEPNVSKRHGVGLNISKEFGADTSDAGVGGKAEVDLNVRPTTFSNLAENTAPRFMRRGFEEGDVGKSAVAAAGQAVDRARRTGQWYSDPAMAAIAREKRENPNGLDDLSLEELQALADRTARSYNEEDYNDADQLASKLYGYEEHGRVSFGEAFIDEFAGSPQTLVQALRRGYEDEKEDNEGLDTSRMDDAALEAAGVSTEEMDEFALQNLDQTDLGISGMLIRGLDAESLVGAAEFVNIDSWLDDTFTFYGSDYVMGDPPTFEEWKQQRYGPEQPAGPESDAQMRARYHKEVAAAGEPPDPVAELGVGDAMQGEIEDQPDELGDYDNSSYREQFGNAFESVADRFRRGDSTEDTGSQHD